MSPLKGIIAVFVALALSACSPAGGVVDVSGAAPPASALQASAAAPQDPDAVYKIQTGDVIEVTLYQLPDLSRVAEVDSAGNINLALIGTVPASRRTLRQLEEEVAGRYRARYLQNPQVSVSMKDSVGLRVTVDGAVRRPGIIMSRGNLTLLRVLAESGGFTDLADQSAVIVMRNTAQGRTVARFDANAIRVGTLPDPPIRGGDTIVVDDSTAKTAWKQFREVLPVANVFRVF